MEALSRRPWANVFPATAKIAPRVALFGSSCDGSFLGVEGTVSELAAVADALKAYVESPEASRHADILDAIEESANEIGKAWSGSWLGYQSRVYFRGLRPAPPGAHFSIEWGFQDALSNETSEGWEEFTPDTVREELFRRAGSPDLSRVRESATAGEKLFNEKREAILSVLETAISARSDSYLERLRDEARGVTLLYSADYVRRALPSSIVSRDSLAHSQGVKAPPHIQVVAEVAQLRSPAVGCRELQRIAENAAAHISRTQRRGRATARIGTNVFIGHGRSPVWKDLRDFVRERLRLPWDEFNRVPVAGVTNVARLSEMLEAAAIAFLILTAEDEQVDGSLRARENVVHEAGLFQGRLGFTRAIILLEEGCQPFSNIDGLGQIRFQKNDISGAFEEVRRVLEREGVLPEPTPSLA